MAAQTTVIIVNWNGARFLEPLLRSVQACKPNRILLVDNASTDQSLEILTGHPGIELICNSANVGFGKAANQGIAISTTPYLLILNADIEVMTGSINRMQHFLEENPAAAVVAPQLMFRNGTIQPSCRLFPTLPKIFMYLSYLDRLIPTGYILSKKMHECTMEVEQPMGAALMIRKKVLDEIGLFDENFFLYMEDVDLCERIYKSGHKIVFLPEARMIHQAGGSSGQDWGRSQKNYLQSLIQYFQKRGKPAGITKATLSAALLLRTVVLLLAGNSKKAGFYGKMIGFVFHLS